jgi:sugar lactone lactonase YvrE
MRRSLGLCFAMMLVAAAVTPLTLATSNAAPSCTRWRMHTIASGLGVLESLVPDHRGAMLLSSSTHDAVERLRRNGHVTTVVAADSPGHLLWRGKRVLFTTGDSSASGGLNRADGTLRLLNPRTGTVHTYARGLTMPNGMALAPNGDAFTTRDVGSGTGITRIRGGKRHTVHPNWSRLADTNGVAIDPRLHVLYVDRTFTRNAPIWRIPLRHPGRAKRIGDLSGVGTPVPKGLDGLTIDRHGVLYLAANSGGEVIRFNPHTGASCVIATGLRDPSDVVFGTGHGWRASALFVCGFDGTVRELDPPVQPS